MSQASPDCLFDFREPEGSLHDSVQEAVQLGSDALSEARPLILIPKYSLLDVEARLPPKEKAEAHRWERCFSLSRSSARTSSHGTTAPGSARWAARRSL